MGKVYKCYGIATSEYYYRVRSGTESQKSCC